MNSMFHPANPISALSPASSTDVSPISLEKDLWIPSKIKKSVQFLPQEGDSSVVVYESHPKIKRTAHKYECPGCDNELCECGGRKRKWSVLTQLYIGSITVVGLYAVFRALQRSH